MPTPASSLEDRFEEIDRDVAQSVGKSDRAVVKGKDFLTDEMNKNLARACAGENSGRVRKYTEAYRKRLAQHVPQWWERS